MFTGIVEGTGTVAALAAADDASRACLEVEAPWLAGELRLGESVAVNGCCVTVAEATAAGFAADLVQETLRRTALGGLAAGARVNLERPMALGGRLGGSSSSHVDGVARVLGGSGGRFLSPGAWKPALGPATSCASSYHPNSSGTSWRRGRSRSTG